MGRIPEEEIERLKRDLYLEHLCRVYGVELKKHGATDLIGRCPFHDDHEPSFVVTPSKNLWHCLGACQQGGSVIDFVMKAEGGVSFRHAVDLLRDRFPQFIASGERRELRTTKRATIPKLENPFEDLAENHEVLVQVVDFYHRTLKESPEALAYLKERGLESSELIDRHKLGFANRSLGYRLPAKNRQAGAELRGRLQELGVLRGTGHEHFNGSLVVPIFDAHGRCVEIYGRKIRNDLRKGTPLHLYLPGPHYGVWNLEAFHASKEIILCEAIIDAMSLWCAGYRNVTACYGVEGFMPDHLEAMKTHGTERVLLAFDRDAAGENAAWKLAQQLNRHGIGAYQVHFPKGMDANEYALSVKPAAKSLGVLLRQAVWLGKGVPVPPDAEPEPSHAPAPLPRRSACAEARASSSLAAIAANEEEQPAPPEPVPALHASPACPAVDGVRRRKPEQSGEPALKCDEVSSSGDVRFTFGRRRYRVRGLAKNTSFDTLKINLLASADESFHVDTLDLYSARQRTMFVNQAATELAIKEEVVKKDLGRVLLKLEEMQEAAITEAMQPRKPEIKIDDPEREAALALLRDKRLLDRILADFDRCGIVGEEINKLTGYLAAVSRKLEAPLAVIVQSSSAAGKSSLMEAILAFMPEEEQVKYSAMTGQSLFYMGESDLKHKILAIVEEEGAERAAYALKLLQSEGELTIASTGKDSTTGRLTTEEYHVEGPVMIFLTTTAAEIDEELLNRCLVLTVNEDREQTRAIHERQRQAQTLEGLLARRDRDTILAVHRNAQRLLRPLLVANPFARELTFLDDRTRTRRDHMKYLTLIRTVALLHQFQRPVKHALHNGRRVEYIEATLDDIATANRLAHEVLGRSLDELAPQTRRLLILLDQMVTQVCKREQIERNCYHFTQRDVRAFTGWTDFQVKTHLRKLADLEYVLTLRGGRGQCFVYELLYQGEGADGRPFVMQLIDTDALRHRYDANREHSEDNREHPEPDREDSGSTQGASKEQASSQPTTDENANNDRAFLPLAASAAREELLGSMPGAAAVMS